MITTLLTDAVNLFSSQLAKCRVFTYCLVCKIMASSLQQLTVSRWVLCTKHYERFVTGNCVSGWTRMKAGEKHLLKKTYYCTRNQWKTAWNEVTGHSRQMLEHYPSKNLFLWILNDADIGLSSKVITNYDVGRKWLWATFFFCISYHLLINTEENHKEISGQSPDRHLKRRAPK